MRNNIKPEAHNLLTPQNAMFKSPPTLRRRAAHGATICRTESRHDCDALDVCARFTTTLRGWKTGDYFEFIIITLLARKVHIYWQT